jgi:hypothetical protein
MPVSLRYTPAMQIGGRHKLEDAIADATVGRDSRQKSLEAAGQAISMILREIGEDCALILLNASIAVVEDRIKAREEARQTGRAPMRRSA